MAVVTGFVVWV